MKKLSEEAQVGIILFLSTGLLGIIVGELHEFNMISLIISFLIVGVIYFPVTYFLFKRKKVALWVAVIISLLLTIILTSDVVSLLTETSEEDFALDILTDLVGVIFNVATIGLLLYTRKEFRK